MEVEVEVEVLMPGGREAREFRANYITTQID